MSCLLSLGAYALASGTTSTPRADKGHAPVSGFEVSRVSYWSRGDLITAVSFDLDAAAAKVDVRLDSRGGEWYECGPSARTPPYSVGCIVRVPVVEADDLTVSARQ